MSRIPPNTYVETAVGTYIYATEPDIEPLRACGIALSMIGIYQQGLRTPHSTVLKSVNEALAYGNQRISSVELAFHALSDLNPLVIAPDGQLWWDDLVFPVDTESWESPDERVYCIDDIAYGWSNESESEMSFEEFRDALDPQIMQALESTL